jgi:hypothetical protein
MTLQMRRMRKGQSVLYIYINDSVTRAEGGKDKVYMNDSATRAEGGKDREYYINDSATRVDGGKDRTYMMCGFTDVYMTESHYSLGMVTRT